MIEPALSENAACPILPLLIAPVLPNTELERKPIESANRNHHRP